MANKGPRAIAAFLCIVSCYKYCRLSHDLRNNDDESSLLHGRSLQSLQLQNDPRTTLLKDPHLLEDDLLHAEDPLYYNVIRGQEWKPVLLPIELYPLGGSVICTLVPDNNKDIEDLTLALRSLAFLVHDTHHPTNRVSPVLVFNEGLTEESIYKIRTSTNRPIAFPRVDFNTFPKGFDPNSGSNVEFTVAGRKKFGYFQMIRYFITTIWEHPAVDRYETVMRIDSDSCFKSPNSYLPYMKHENVVYHSQFVGVVAPGGVQFLQGLYDFAESYPKQPSFPELWHIAETSWKKNGTLPLLMTNFELSKKSWMTSPEMRRWHHALTEQEPYGVLRYRWGDAITRFLAASLFGTSETILTTKPEGYYHKQQCKKADVEEALREHNIL